MGREENGGIKDRRSSFTCTNIDRNVNTAQLFLKCLGMHSNLHTSFPCLISLE